MCEHLFNDFYFGSVHYGYMERKQKRVHIFQTQEIIIKSGTKTEKIDSW